MSPTEIGATATVAGVIVTIVGSLLALVWNAGKHSQRLDAAEKDIEDLQTTQGEHSTAIAAFEGFQALLKEVRDDVKDLIRNGTGRRSPGPK